MMNDPQEIARELMNGRCLSAYQDRRAFEVVLAAVIQAERDRATQNYETLHDRMLSNQRRADEAENALAGAREDTARLEHYLRNLLAVIHRDGHHYVAKHGLEKASLDAETIVFNGRR